MFVCSCKDKKQEDAQWGVSESAPPPSSDFKPPLIMLNQSSNHVRLIIGKKDYGSWSHYYAREKEVLWHLLFGVVIFRDKG